MWTSSHYLCIHVLISQFTFVNLAATRVIKKREHALSDVKFQLKRPIAISYRDDVIILRNVTPNTSIDLLSMYFEKLCGSSPENIAYNHDKTAVMAAVSCKIGEVIICYLICNMAKIKSFC